jgi:hypothetical protein
MSVIKNNYFLKINQLLSTFLLTLSVWLWERDLVSKEAEREESPEYANYPFSKQFSEGLTKWLRG